MASEKQVTPNRRGLRSREAVLDAAETVMAERGYAAATMSAIVEAAGVPVSSVYHYFGSKDGVLVAVMERGADRFFADVRPPSELTGDPTTDLQAAVEAMREALDRQPAFLRLLIVLAMQSPLMDQHDVRAVVLRVRATALAGLRAQVARVFELPDEDERVARLAQLSLAMIDGAFVAQQSDSTVSSASILDLLPAALVATRETV